MKLPKTAPDEMRPPYWIHMGAVAITTLVAHLQTLSAGVSSRLLGLGLPHEHLLRRYISTGKRIALDFLLMIAKCFIYLALIALAFSIKE